MSIINSTTRLGLQQPSNNALPDTWGTALNGNMDLIDKFATSTDARIATLDNKFNALNFILISEDEPFARLEADTLVSCIWENNAWKEVRTYNIAGIAADNNEYQIPNYQGFRVINADDIEFPSGSGTSYNSDDIIIKTTKIVDNSQQAVWIKFGQSLGGYYKPRTDANTANSGVLIYDKITTPQAATTVEIDIGKPIARHAVFRTSIGNVGSLVADPSPWVGPFSIPNDGGVAYTLNLIKVFGSRLGEEMTQELLQDVTLPPRVDVQWMEYSGYNITNACVDYYLSSASGHWELTAIFAQEPTNLYCYITLVVPDVEASVYTLTNYEDSNA